MDNRQKEIENLKDYKYGFSTDIENIQAPKGLNVDVINHVNDAFNFSQPGILIVSASSKKTLENIF